MKKTIAALVMALALTGCAETAVEGPAFPKDHYSPKVQKRIDSLEKQADCKRLQNEFDTADANKNDGKADLLAYIDKALKDAGCYE